MMSVTSPEEKARMAIACNGSLTYTDQTMIVIPGWGVAPMNWPHHYRIIMDGLPVGDPIFAPEGFWKVMDELAESLGVR